LSPVLMTGTTMRGYDWTRSSQKGVRR